MYADKNEALARDIRDFLFNNDIYIDTRIYFNNKCYHGDSHGIKCIEDIKASRYFEYANDDTVSMSFEGDLYHIINGGRNNLLKRFNDIFEKHNCYYELGYAWSLSVYYD